jgi:hypothetical protein
MSKRAEKACDYVPYSQCVSKANTFDIMLNNPRRRSGYLKANRFRAWYIEQDGGRIVQ